MTSGRGNNYGSKAVARVQSKGNVTIEPGANIGISPPCWLRISRSGDAFTADASTDGVNWTVLATHEIPDMPSEAHWGVFHYGGPFPASTLIRDYQLATVSDISFSSLPAPESPTFRGISGQGSVQVRWNPTEAAEGYRLERRTETGQFEFLIELGGGHERYTDGDVSFDSGYEYRIKAFNVVGESAWSAPRGVVTAGSHSVTAVTVEDGRGADAMLRADDPDGNYGGATEFSVSDIDENIQELSQVTKALLRFEIPELPWFWGAQLKLSYTGGSNLLSSPRTSMIAYLLEGEASETWDESSVTWNNAPQNDTTGLGLITGSRGEINGVTAEGLPAVGEQVSIDVPTWIRGIDGREHLATHDFMTFILAPEGRPSNNAIMNWASREHPKLPPPTLEIETNSLHVTRPAFLTASPTDEGTELTWFEPFYGREEAEIEIERRAVHGEWSRIALLPEASGGYLDTTPEHGLLYEYRLRAVWQFLPSAWSGPVLTRFDDSATTVAAVTSDDGGVSVEKRTGPNNYGPVSFKFGQGLTSFVSEHRMIALRNDLSGWIGTEFEVGEKGFTVHELGRWVAPGNEDIHALRLVDATTGVVLAFTAVDTAGAPVGSFLYAALPNPVDLNPGQSCYLLSQESAGGDCWYDFAVPIPGSATGYQRWLLSHGLPMDGSGLGSPKLVLNNDGLPNLVKFALGLPPTSNGDGGRIQIGTTADENDNEYMAFTFTRPEPPPAEIHYAVEAGSTLQPDDWSSVGLTEVGNTVNGNTRTITIRDRLPISDHNARFMRLRVSHR